MSNYIESVLEITKKKNPAEKEFIQAVSACDRRAQRGRAA